jgi:DNA-binding NtrC family response regulator
LQAWLIDSPIEQGTAGQSAGETAADGTTPAGTKLEDLERRMIETTLDHFDGHRAKAAQALGIGIRTLSNKLRQYGYAPRTRAFAKAA